MALFSSSAGSIKIKMTRKPKPDIVPYLRLLMGPGYQGKRMSGQARCRLWFAEAAVKLVIESNPNRSTMAAFIRSYAAGNGVSRSFCYKVLASLCETTLVKWDDYWGEYRINMERWKRDRKALQGFKSCLANYG